jgi:hypothetical protein
MVILSAVPLHYPSTSATPSPQAASLLAQLQSGQIFQLAPDCQGGLIIEKQFYSDFAGPGAAIGGQFDAACVALYAVGTIQVRSLESRQKRLQAIQIRAAYAERLGKIASLQVPLRRGSLIIEQLCKWLPHQPHQTMEAIADEQIAQLVGILPTTVRLSKRSQKQALSR